MCSKTSAERVIYTGLRPRAGWGPGRGGGARQPALAQHVCRQVQVCVSYRLCIVVKHVCRAVISHVAEGCNVPHRHPRRTHRVLSEGIIQLPPRLVLQRWDAPGSSRGCRASTWLEVSWGQIWCPQAGRRVTSQPNPAMQAQSTHPPTRPPTQEGQPTWKCPSLKNREALANR